MLMRYHSPFIEVSDRTAQPSTKPALPAKWRRCPSRARVYCARSTSPAEPDSSIDRPAAPSQNKVRPIQCRPNPKVAHMAKVAFLGLGVMGFPMAGHLAKKGGHEVTVFNRTPAQALALAGVRLN